MKRIHKKAAFVIILFFIYMTNVSILSHSYMYTESAEQIVPKLKLWAKDAEYKLNYLGATDEKTIDGKKSLKMDITVYGDGDRECFYYWVIPVKVKYYGEMIHSIKIWADSLSAKYVSAGINFVYPPEDLKIKLNPAIQSGRWVKLTDSSDREIKAAIGGDLQALIASYKDPEELNRVGIFIRAKGEHRLRFYLSDIELKGKTFNISDYQKSLRNEWENYCEMLGTTGGRKTAPGDESDVYASVNKYENLSGPKGLKQPGEEGKMLQSIIEKAENPGRLSFEKFNELSRAVSDYKVKSAFASAAINKLESKAAVFSIPATKFNRLTGTNLPSDARPIGKLTARVCAGQYEALSVIIQPKEKLREVEVNWTKFTGGGRTLEASVLDVSVAKVWYQAGIKSTEINNKLLTQELLLKNDKLIKVDTKTQSNYLWITDSKGSGRYVDISTPTALFPEDAIVKDSKTLQPFEIEENTNKQLWFTLHIPEDAKEGEYESEITIEHRDGILSRFTIEVQVLPFKLDASRLTYSLYYHGALRDWKLRPFHCEDKTAEQLLIELKDMKEHGVFYPNNYQDLKHLGANLEIRNKAGLPNDRIYSTLLDWCTSLAKSASELNIFKQRVSKFKTEAEKYGYRDLYIYGIDEARGQRLKDQRPMWQAAHEAGAKIFVAGYEDTFTDMGDLLDVGIIQGPLNKEQPALYHSAGHKVFSYSNPQAGQENPEIYRRNYGLALWKFGYDGSMDYAYQKNYGSIWNDFDNPRYREEVFTYPTSDGIISTIQWEGFRQGVNDVRFISTLLNRIEKLRSAGKDVSRIEKWVNSIDISMDPDDLRAKIIDKILSINYL